MIIIKGQKVLLQDPNTFSLNISQAKLDSITLQMAHHQRNIQTSGNPLKANKKSKTNLAKLARNSKKWVPLGKTLYLDTLEYNNKLYDDLFDKQSLLGKFWSNTFCHKNIDEQKADEFLFEFSTDFHLSDISPTTSKTIANYLKCTRDSATGDNTIPSSVYRNSDYIVHGILANTSLRAQYGYVCFLALITL